MPSNLFNKHDKVRAGFISNFFLVLFGSIALIVVLAFAGLQWADSHSQFQNKDVLKIYCAASVVQPVEKAMEAFHSITGTPVIIVRIGGSGELMGAVQAENISGMSQGADVLILADHVLTQKANSQEVLTHTKTIATQSPVIGIHHSISLNINSLQTMLSTRFGVGSDQTAIGQTARQLASEQNLLTSLEVQKATETENVMILAQAVASGNLETAILWQTVVDQVNQNYDSPRIRVATGEQFPKEFDGQITVSLTTRSRHTSGPLFVQFLSESEEAGFAFEQFGFSREGHSP